MDRRTARRWIDQHVRIDEEQSGAYAGVLEEVITHDRKPWEGRIRIKGVLRAPQYNNTKETPGSLLYEKDELITAAGRKISPLTSPFTLSYKESYGEAVKQLWDIENEQVEAGERMLSVLQQELRTWQMEHLLQESSYAYYEFYSDNNEDYLYDDRKKDTLSLEGCPFEFEIQTESGWVPAYYRKKGTFEEPEGQILKVSNGDSLRLDKEQFDPYKMLVNEISDPALQALERGLKKFGLGHENCVHCHNSLLMHLLASFSKKEFKGVNFITFSNGSNQVIVQHHYERTVQKNNNTAFDRFEFTADNGRRMITAYSAQASPDNK
jgi:hypothetical protein